MLALLLIFPAFVGCSINIHITPATKTTDASVHYTGSSTWSITEADQKIFHVTYAEISRNSIEWGYKEPSYVSMHRGGINPDGVEVTIKPVNVKILKQNEETVVLAEKNVTNEYGVSMVFKADLKGEVIEFVQTTWNSCPDLAGADIDIALGGGSLSVVSAWGKWVYQSRPKILSPDSDVQMILTPGQEARATLKAKKATMRVEIEYEATLSGSVCVQYTWLLIVADIRCLPINSYLRFKRLPSVLTASEIISVAYYYGAEVAVKEEDEMNWDPTTHFTYRFGSSS